MLAARSALAEAKFKAICTALKIAGKERLARKLYAGWKVKEQRLQFSNKPEYYVNQLACWPLDHL